MPQKETDNQLLKEKNQNVLVIVIGKTLMV